MDKDGAKARAMRLIAGKIKDEIAEGWPLYDTERAIAAGFINEENLEPTWEGTAVMRALSDEVQRMQTIADDTERAPCVIIESPFRGEDFQRAAYKRYAHQCIADCISRGEAPFASHMLYTEALDDNDENQRKAGIRLGSEVGRRMDMTVVYADLGISEGMQRGIDAAKRAGRPVVYRSIVEGGLRDE